MTGLNLYGDHLSGLALAAVTELGTESGKGTDKGQSIAEFFVRLAARWIHSRGIAGNGDP